MNTETNYVEHCYASISNDIDTLTKNAEEYPFSSVARFLLLYHSKKNHNPSFEQLAKQSAIYFNNIPWIQYQLGGIGKNEIEIEKGSEMEFNNEPMFRSETQAQHELANEQITQIPDQHIKYETETLGVSGENQIVGKEESHQTPAIVNEQITQNPDQPIKYETQVLGVSGENQILDKEEADKMHSLVNEQITQIPDQHIKHETETLGVSGENQILDKEEADKMHSLVNGQITQIPDQHIKHETETLGVSGEDQIVAKEESPETPATANEQITQNPDQDSQNTEEQVLFEPLHTVDYFASQGIKISEEELEKDHLGQQVKSFTAWLKSMKRLHPGQLPEQNEVIEKIIQTSSEASNQNAHVLTEAMAEVLVKQGKREKAIEMYEKLSLLNPSKSAYFAPKIESLKII